MNRVISVIVFLIATLFGLMAAPGLAPASSATTARGCDYDAHHYATFCTDTTTERGLPSSYGQGRTYDVLDGRSTGASSRHGRAAASTVCSYDHPVLLAQVAGVGATTRRLGEGTPAALASLSSSGVAANGGDDLTRVGRWMSRDEHSAMVRTREVQVGGGGTTYVSHPPSIEVWRRQASPSSVYIEFDVPQSVLRPGGQPGHAQIPSPSHPLYGRLAEKTGVPLQHPVPACNIVLVGS